jgi:ketosteroid isomerase-like protein
MSKFLPIALAASTLLLAACQGGGDPSGIAKAKDAYFAAWTKSDAEPFTTARLAKVIETSPDFFSIDGMAPSPTLSGWKAYEATWAAGMNQFKSAKLVEVSTHRTWLGNGFAASASEVRVTATMPDGTKLDMPAHVTLVFQQIHGEWRVVHENMNLPPKQ